MPRNLLRQESQLTNFPPVPERKLRRMEQAAADCRRANHSGCPLTKRVILMRPGQVPHVVATCRKGNRSSWPPSRREILMMGRGQVPQVVAMCRRGNRSCWSPSRREIPAVGSAPLLWIAAAFRRASHSCHHPSRKEIRCWRRAQVLRAAAACRKGSHGYSRQMTKETPVAAVPALRPVGSSGMGIRRTMQAGRKKTVLARRRQQPGPPRVLRGPARSAPAALPQAVLQDVDLEGRWAPGKAPGRRDTIQRLAVRPDRCAMRFPAGQVAGKAAAPQAAPPCARLRREAD